MLEIDISRQRLETAKQSLDEMVNGRKFQIRDKISNAGKRNNGRSYGLDGASDPSIERCLGASLNCFAVIDLLWNRTVQTGALERNSPAPAIFSAYIGAEYGLAGLDDGGGNGGRTRVDGRSVFGNERIDFGRMYPLFLEDILGAYSRALDNPGKMEMSRLTGQFFGWIKEKTIAESERVADFEKKAGLIKGSICEDYVFIGLNSRKPRAKDADKEFCWENFGGYKKEVDYFRELATIIDRYDYCLSLNAMKKDELLPKGILLAGPPGTGKTRLARTFCNEAGVPFEMFGVSDVGSSFVYETSNNVQRKFDAAAGYIKSGESRAAVLFIDELDSLGRTRSRSSGAGSEDDKVVTALNINMDGHLAVDGVIVIGATNLPDTIDPALTRPGRFGKTIYMGFVGADDAKDIFSKYLTGCEGVDVEMIVGRYVAEPGRGYKAYQMQNPERSPDGSLNDSQSGILNRSRDDRLLWNGAMIKEAVSSAKRRKLIGHLKGAEDYRITTEDICGEIESLYFAGRDM
jgi:hypothetical protein